MALTGTAKRPAQEPLLPLRASKQPRLNHNRLDGQVASPSQDMGILGWLGNFWRSSVSPDTTKGNQDTNIPNGTFHAPSQSPTQNLSLDASPTSSQSSPPRRAPATSSPSLPESSTASSSRRTVSAQSTSTTQTSAPSSSAHTLVGPSSSQRLDQAISSSVLKRNQADQFVNGRKRDYRNKRHIFHDQHKSRVLEDRKTDMETMQKEAYQAKRASGYSSDYETFKGWANYRALLEKGLALYESKSHDDLPSSSWLGPRPHGRRHSSPDVDADRIHMERALAKAKSTMNEPRPPKPFTPSFQKIWDSKTKLPPFPTALPPDKLAQVKVIQKKRGIVAKCAREQVSNSDIARLAPRSWLNDECINFYGAMILARSEATKENAPKFNGNESKSKIPTQPLDCWYFSTFFWPKLVKDGYDTARLAKWTKKFDIFEKDVILIPVNHNNSHWTSAAINFRKKRIESYDSMSMYHTKVYKYLRGYLDSESKNKKKKPFDFTGWVDYTPDDVPQQENGHDCGVFTCCFLEAISRGEEPFRFTQQHMPYLRQRLTLEMGTAQLLEPQ